MVWPGRDPARGRRSRAGAAVGRLSQTEFSIQAGISERTLRNFLTQGKMRRSSLDGVAKAMGLTLEQLLRGELPASMKSPRRR